MKIILPNKLNSTNTVELESQSIIVIGANGSGKTRFGSDIETRYLNQTHRVAAQKSLSMPSEVSPKSKDKAEIEFWYGRYYDHEHTSIQQKLSNRWGRKPSTFLLDDYAKLMVLLHTEEYEESLKYKEGLISKPFTKLDRIQKIWEDVLTHRRLIKRAGVIETYPTNKPHEKYNASEMSDGERVIFYLVGEVICAKPNSIIIIDEPEVHIHKSITKKLWDAIEKERPDCTFIYLTHDIDFAISRYNANKIWLKSYEGKNIWDYEILNNGFPIPEQVYLEILGSRKPILFIEGDNSSIDYILYQQIFSDYTVTPLGNCNKVIESTKSFNEQNHFHHIKSYGIIDRDRRTEVNINEIRKNKIWVPEVAESENLLLLEEVIKIVAKRMFKNPEDIFAQVKSNIINLFKEQLQYQSTQHTIFRIKKYLERNINPKVKEFAELQTHLTEFWTDLNYESMYNEVEKCFNQLISTNNYNGILKVFNNKGLIYASSLPQLCGLNSKNDEYLNFIIGILKEKSSDSNEIIKSIREQIK